MCLDPYCQLFDAFTARRQLWDALEWSSLHLLFACCHHERQGSLGAAGGTLVLPGGTPRLGDVCCST